MRHNKALTLVALLIALTVAISSADAKEESRTVSARMGGGSGGGVGIQARHEPGFFTVSEGHLATGFSYNFSDPASNYTSTRLGPANIYSVTLGRDIREAEGNPNVQLPPGKYKFIVGGRPGASGTLSFKIVSTTGDPPSDQPTTNGRRLPRDFDVTYNPLTDIYVIEKGSRKQIGDFDGQQFWNWPTQVVVRFRNGQVSSQFEMAASGEHHRYRHVSTMAGTLSEDGRFSGTDTGNSVSQVTLASGQILNHEYGHVYALSGQVDANGLLVIHGRWQSDHGQMEAVVQNNSGGVTADGNGRYQTRMEPYDSKGNCAGFTTEIHLRLPVGQPHSSETLTRDRDRSAPPRSPDPGRTPPNGSDIADVPRDSIWSNDNNDTTWNDTSEPPVDQDSPNGSDHDNIWSTKETPDDRGADNDAVNDGPDDNPKDEPEDDKEGPGKRLSDGRILFKPPWDEGDAYPMDEEEVKEIQKKQSEGFRWDKRNGWVDDKRQKEIDDIADIQRRNDKKQKKRSDEIADKLKVSEKSENQHAAKAKRAGDEALATKVKALGWDSLSQDERDQLGSADDDIKDGLRGKPKTVRGYERGIVDKTLPQGAIDATHTALQGAKTVIDETMNVLESKTGPAGKVISKTYTVTSSILGKASEANANYHAGTTDKLDYNKAVVEGAKEGVTSVILDEIGGKLNDKVTDRLLDSKVGKKAADYVESKANQAKKKATRDFVSGRSDSLNARVLDDVSEAAAERAKQNVNYTVGRTTKPGYDATLGQPVKDAVDWAVGGEDPKAEAADSDSSDDSDRPEDEEQ